MTAQVRPEFSRCNSDHWTVIFFVRCLVISVRSFKTTSGHGYLLVPTALVRSGLHSSGRILRAVGYHACVLFMYLQSRGFQSSVGQFRVQWVTIHAFSSCAFNLAALSGRLIKFSPRPAGPQAHFHTCWQTYRMANNRSRKFSINNLAFPSS